MTFSVRPRGRPCASCPYRLDVPSGLWDAAEYELLPLYDAETWAQPIQAFMCHSSPSSICAGWAGCHDMTKCLAARIAVTRGMADTVIFTYESPVPLFASGAEAAEHGLRGIENPSPEAIAKLERTLSRRRC